MEGKNLIEPDRFGDHTNADVNYFYHIWYAFKYREVLSKTVQSKLNPCSILNQCFTSLLPTLVIWIENLLD